MFIEKFAIQKMPGFVKLLTASDIPSGGINNFATPDFSAQAEEVL